MVIEAPTPTGAGVGGGSYIFSNVWEPGVVNPSLFAKKVWGSAGG
jgi:hypothetical protein